jgi:uncharacterized protein (DUF1501 family)
MKRRDFIKHIPLGLAAASVPFSIAGFSGRAFGRSPILDSLLNTQAASNDRILVIINLAGGNDGLNTVIPFNDPKYDANRGNIGYVSSADKALLTPYQVRPNSLALNPVMGTDFMNLYKDGKLAILQNVGYADPNRSHFRATDIWNSASDSLTVLSTGWVGRYLQTQVPDDYPLDIGPADPVGIAISTATTLIYQGDRSVMGVAVSDPSKYTSASNYGADTIPDNNYGTEVNFVRGVLQQSDQYGNRFKTLFANPNSTTNKVTYPSGNPLAMQLQKVAWCIQAGMTTKVYFVQQGGYDTHVQQNSKDPLSGQGILHRQLAEAITTFQKDMEAMQVADRVVGMTYSEFGRRVNQNSTAGTDHGTSAPMFVFGNAVNGNVFGSNPNLTDLDVYGDLKNEFDFRQVYSALLGQWFGVDQSMRKAVLNNFDATSLQFAVNASSNNENIFKDAFVSVHESTAAPNFILYQNYPNPVRNETKIRFDLGRASRVTLEVFDARGELVATLVNAYHPAGPYTVSFDPGKLANGMYYYRLDAGGTVETKALTILR